MKVTPLEIRKHEFGKQIRGYDMDEVNSFIEMVADNYETLLNRNRELESELENLQTKVQEYRQMESTLQDAMITAKKAGQKAQVESGEQAELVIQKAKLEAERLIYDTRKRHQRLLDDIHQLEGQRRSYILKMKQILRGQIELLEILEEISPEDKEDNNAG